MRHRRPSSRRRTNANPASTTQSAIASLCPSAAHQIAAGLSKIVATDAQPGGAAAGVGGKRQRSAK